MPNLKWVIDGVNYNEKKFEMLTDEPFVINITDKNASIINNILVMKIDTARRVSKYECILDNNVTIRRNFIEIVGNFKTKKI